MNKFDKMRISAFKDGIIIGYVKSVSYKNGTYILTQDKMFAKTYSKEDRVMNDIDTIAYYGMKNGVSFSIDY